MIQEDLITYETALLAKSKGFDEICTYNYSEIYGLIENMNGLKHSDGNNRFVSVPTQALLQKYLRDKHDTHIEISRNYEKGYYLYEYFIDKNNQEFGFKSYEECLEYALQQALNLI